MLQNVEGPRICQTFLHIIAVLLSAMLCATPQSAAAYAERMGMIQSTDHGATWAFKGYANFHAPLLNPVDPTALVDNGLSVVYFFDLLSLDTDTAIVYRSVATDASGLDFTPPTVAFRLAGDLTDPCVVRFAAGKYRMYVHSPVAILSATSNDGFVFTIDQGERTRDGGVPGALVLPGDSVRLFVCGKGITSLKSGNGLDFAPEPGTRIQIPFTGQLVADPHPIKCQDGKYRMAYKVRPKGTTGPELDEVHLAESDDGVDWNPGPASIAIGSVPSMIELPDGRLRIYYVDFTPAFPTSLFRLTNRTPVTPDSVFLTGSFVRVGYVGSRDHLAVTFSGLHKLPGGPIINGRGVKEYTPEMLTTSVTGILTNDDGDSNGRIVGDSYYDAVMAKQQQQPDSVGWRISKFDVTSWTKVKQLFFPVDFPREDVGDMMLASVNSQLDFSAGYTSYGGPAPPDTGAATHHQFFTTDLQFQGKKILNDFPHIVGSSLLFVDNIYCLVSASAYTGNVVVMKYDQNWRFLEAKKLIDRAHWPTGMLYDGKRYYIAYLDTRLFSVPTFFPYCPNVHLAAFDSGWNLVDDIAVTNFSWEDSLFTGRPSVFQWGNRLYVSYDVVPWPEDLSKIEGFVSVYELTPAVSAVPVREDAPTTFQLDQNYPNPFNPLTVVRYQLPVVSWVKLVVYDLLGREVAVLVNERKGPGSYEVEFGAAGLASGAYLCRLSAGTFVQTRKMLLIQ